MPGRPGRPPATGARALRRVRAAILGWYAVERRGFPWRGTSDRWAVLVSEVMLQQTQASRVAERFPPFLQRFPTPASMALATDREVLAAWSGLGYNRRALAVRRAALAVERDGWPTDVRGLERLPGVGPYTARAVAALALGQAVGAVDTNVRRWLVRRFRLGMEAGANELQCMADGLAVMATNAVEAADWMHASMEFGARVCTARSPRCDACPVAVGCPSRGRAALVPVPRQPPFAGSARATRGAVLRSLSAAPGHALPGERVESLAADAQLEAVLRALERDGLIHRLGEMVHLGPPATDPAAATIGP